MLPQTPKSWRIYELTLLLTFILLGAWQLFVPPILGVADTNDSAKLIGRYCLRPAQREQARPFEYVAFQFARDPHYCWNSGMPSSAQLPLLAAFFLSSGGFQPKVFDTRALGAVYLGLLIAGFYGLQRLLMACDPHTRFAVPIAVVLIFDNATYVPSLNTFFLDTASLVFLLLAFVWLARIVLLPSIRSGEYALAAGCVVLFATSKVQHSLLALAAIPALWCSLGRPVFPNRFLRVISIATVIGCVAWMLQTTSNGYRTTNLYNALFLRALPHSPHAAADLAEFGIDEKYLDRVGQHAFLPDSPLNDPQQSALFSRWLTYPKMMRYYLTHPVVTGRAFLHAMDEGSRIRAEMTIGETEYRLGNYAREAHVAPRGQSHFLDVWTGMKSLAFAGRPLVYVGYALMVLAELWTIAARLSGNARKRAMLLAGSLTWLIVLAPVVVLSDGVDTGRHLFLYNAILDLALCAIVGMLVLPSRGKTGDGGHVPYIYLEKQQAPTHCIGMARV